MPPRTSRALLERYVRTGDESAFEELVSRYGPMISRVAERLLGASDEVEDVVQIAFAELATRAGTIADPGAVAGWLHTIAIRSARRLRERRESVSALSFEPLTEAANFEEISRRDQTEVLAEEVERLPPAWREALLLRYFLGVSSEDAAAFLGTSVSAYEGRLKRARKTLRVRLIRRGVTGAIVAATLAETQTTWADDEWQIVSDSAQIVDAHGTDVGFTGQPSRAATNPLLVKPGSACGAIALVLLVIGSGTDEVSSVPAVSISTVAAADDAESPTETSATLNAATAGSEPQPAVAGSPGNDPLVRRIPSLGVTVRLIGQEFSVEDIDREFYGGLEIVSIEAGGHFAASGFEVSDVLFGFRGAGDSAPTLTELRRQQSVRTAFVIRNSNKLRDVDVTLSPSDEQLLTDYLRDAIGDRREPQHRPLLWGLKADASLQFVDQPLGSALRFIADAYEINLDVDKNEFDRLQIDTEVPFTLVISGGKLGESLGIILSEKIGGLDYAIQDNRLIVTSTEKAGRIHETRVYDLPNLLSADAAVEAVQQHASTSLRGPIAWAESDEADVGGRVLVLRDPQDQVTRIAVTQSNRGHEAVLRFLESLELENAPATK